jgi:DNA-binding CsgD family transcriptional regulator
MDDVLVERQQELDRLTALAADAEEGSGRLVLVGGEAGIGKSALLGARAASFAGRLAIRRGGCDGSGPRSPLGPLLEAVPELAEGLGESADRRVLFQRLRGVLAEPTLLVLEDLHWADEATLHLLNHLGRRLTGLPLLAVASFRDDEVPEGSLLAVLLGDLATASGVQRMTLAPLSPQGVRRLVEAAGSPLDADELWRGTEGNAFFVTEVLAAGGPELPASVRDAVLARTARLSPEARRVLAAAAVLADRAALRLLTRISGAPPEAVDECVRAGMLVPGRDGLAFRHELARRAVDQATPPGARARLHAVALQELRAEGDDDARLALHAEASGDRAAVLASAPRAAARSARLGAHREAAELYRLALRAAGSSHPRRAELCEALSYECHLTNQVHEAFTARQDALRTAMEEGDRLAVGRHRRWLARLSWFLGRHADEVRFAREAVATLADADEGHELAMAHATLAGAHMHAADTAGAVAEGERALVLARRLGDVDVEMHALATVGTALAGRDDAPEGWRLLRRSLELALHHDADEHAGRAYLNLSALALLNRRYPLIDAQLPEALAYCEERDLDAFGIQVLLGGARSFAEQGRYAEADELLARLRHRPSQSPINRMAVHHVTGQIAARRTGERGRLEESWRLAELSGEEQQIVPATQSLAEADWIAGHPERIAAEIDRAWPLAAVQGNPWSLGELSWWLSRVGRCREAPVPVAEPFRLMLEGAWHAAARRWSEIGCRLWVAYALGNSPDPADGRRARAIAEEIGAVAAARAIVRDRQARGLSTPHGPRTATRANPGRLTARELEVLRLLAEGLSNAELAARLFLSERTVAHHVSAVLQKLGEPSRARAVATARRQGILAATVE